MKYINDRIESEKDVFESFTSKESIKCTILTMIMFSIAKAHTTGRTQFYEFLALLDQCVQKIADKYFSKGSPE
jgi:hypothetical protein